MSSEPILSVIIPVYRTEAYLRECLRSVAIQSLQDIEVIIVNDGSPDRSQDIINAYCFIYDRFSCVCTANQGQSAARNQGLKLATGRYLVFLDSDDRLPRDAYQTLVDAAERTAADICVGVAQSFNQQREWINPQNSELAECVSSHAKLDDCLALVRDASPCNKVFRRDLITKERLEFPEGIGLREDLHFVLRAYAAAGAITVLPSVVYHYRARAKAEMPSMTELVNPKVFDDLLWVSRDLDERLGSGVSPAVLEEKTLAILSYVSDRLGEFVLANPGEQRAQTLDAIHRYLQTLPSKLVRRHESSDSSGLLQLVANGRFDEARTRAEELRKKDGESRRHKPLGKRIQRIQRKSKARGKRALTSLKRPSFNAAAREAKLAVAVGRKRINVRQTEGKPIWVVGERHGQSAEDTGFAFFKFLRAAHPEVDAYFVTKPGAKGAAEAAAQGNILEYGSLAAYEMLLRAEVLAYSDSGLDFFSKWSRIAPRLRRDAVGCFLQHGVISLCSSEYYSKNSMRKRNECFDLFVTASPMEKDIVVRHLGFSEEEVAVTGLSRFDSLTRGAKGKREILYMPTWRPWLRYAKNGDDFTSSHFFCVIQNLLSDLRLHRLLERHDFQLNFLDHFAMGARSSYYRSPTTRIQIVSSNSVCVQEYIKNSQLLITDYSSVAYDFAYQERTSLFYHFDAEKNFNERGMLLIDPTTSMMGDVVRSQDEVLRYLEKWLQSDLQMPTLYRERADAFFEYTDANNCERIFQAIRARQKSKR